MMQDLYHSLPLPDDQPITSLCVVEEISGCPANYRAVCKTHDQDIDADLTKDGFFKKVTRYLCFSKSEGFFGYVVENILILNEKESRPPGYTIIDQATDSNQKAFRKKQLCYKSVPRHMASQVITDIIILSKAKEAPEGFSLIGEMNNLLVCYKPGPGAAKKNSPQSGSPLPYGVNPIGRSGSQTSVSSEGGGGRKVGGSSFYPAMNGSTRLQNPSRPAPAPPTSNTNLPGPYDYSAPSDFSSLDTNAIYGVAQSSLHGVPFQLNKNLIDTSPSCNQMIMQSIIVKCPRQIDDEYQHSFLLEQDIVNRLST